MTPRGCQSTVRVRNWFTVCPNLWPPDAVVVVNCAGRTRSIIGAQSLINAGLTNKVFALRNGTMGWELAGFQVDRGKTVHAETPSADGGVRAREMAQRFAERTGVETIEWRDYLAFSRDSERTCYLFDVRTSEEYLDGHIPGAFHAPGGQLVQATDSYIGTLRSRVVLTDDENIRDLMTAAWLKLSGWQDVFVLRGPIDVERQQGARAVPMPVEAKSSKTLSASELATLMTTDAVYIIDLATSAEFHEGTSHRRASRSALDSPHRCRNSHAIAIWC